MTKRGNTRKAKKHKCECGRIAVDKFKGVYICDECLNPDYEPTQEILTESMIARAQNWALKGYY